MGARRLIRRAGALRGFDRTVASTGWDGESDRGAEADLNAVTDAQWKTLFRFGREDPDSDLGRQLLMRVNEKHTNLPYIWIAAFLAGFGAVIGAIRARAFIRREARSLTVPVQLIEPELAETHGSP